MLLHGISFLGYFPFFKGKNRCIRPPCCVYVCTFMRAAMCVHECMAFLGFASVD